jgi:hypothetical protein
MGEHSDGAPLMRPVMGGQPIEPQRGPASRHYIRNVRQNSYVRDRNTVIEPWVDIDADVGAILVGNAARAGDTFEFDGRRWGVESNGTLYPISGPGFIRLDRESYRALGVYNTFGDTPQAAAILDRMHNQTPASRRNGLHAWRAGRHNE